MVKTVQSADGDQGSLRNISAALESFPCLCKLVIERCPGTGNIVPMKEQVEAP